MKDIDPRRIERVLVRGTNWVGDAVMSVPALRAIRGRFPRAHITLLVRPWVRDVYSAVDFVDEVFEYDTGGAHRGWRGMLRLSQELGKRRFDLAILLQNAFRAALLARLAGIPLRVGYARDGRGFLLTHPCSIAPEVESAHQVYYYLGLLEAARLAPEEGSTEAGAPPSIAIGVREADRRSARKLLAQAGANGSEPLIGINPGASYGGAKRWLPDRFAAAADLLAERYSARIVLVGSASDLPAAEEVARRLRARPIVLAGRTTLGQLMALLRELRLLVTNDSGPMHLAAALDVPQVAIFGSSSEAATGPLGARARVVRHPVPCSPCFLRECPIDLRCMTRVSTDSVVEAAASLLG